MKYYFLDGTMTPSTPAGPEFKQLLDAHHQYMAPYFASGKILTSGPKVGSRGGIILIRLDDDETIDDFIAGDPFVKSGIQSYAVTPFSVFQIQEYAKAWTE